MIKYLENKKRLVYFILSSLALFLVFFNFYTTPKVWVDEGVFTEVSRNFSRHGILGIQTGPNDFYKTEGFVLSTSYPVIFPVALSFKLFGVGLFQSRFPMLVFIVLFLFSSFLFVKKRYGFYPAILSSLLLLSFSPIYGNGRPVQGEVPGIFFLVFGSYLLLFLEEGGFINRKLAFFTGVVLGLSSATKAIYLTFISISLIISLFIWYKKIKNRSILFFVFLGYIIPNIIWYFIHFYNTGSFLEIINSYFYFAGTHNSSVSLWDTIYKNFLRFFTESTPILFFVLSLFVLFYYIFKYKKDGKFDVTISEFILVSFIFLNFLGYLKGTGWYRYFFPANALIYLFFPASVLFFSGFLKNTVIKKILFFIPIGLILFQFYHLVFLSDTSFVLKRNRNIELSKEIGSMDINKKILFYNSIETIVFYKGNDYSQYLKMDDFLVAGDKDSIKNTTYDYILTDENSGVKVTLSCYKKREISTYYLFEKEANCKTKI